MFVLYRTGEEKGNEKTLGISFEKGKKIAFVERVLYITQQQREQEKQNKTVLFLEEDGIP